MKKPRALVLLSGGLDSMLSARILIEQGVEVTGLTFVSYFFGSAKGKVAAEKLGVKHIEYDFKDEHLGMVKNPKYGYGSNMNPCIDCHSMMLRIAKEIMEKEGFDFVATGEVLGQRPMSQNKNALDIVAKFSGIGDKLVRPLSGKLLGLTDPEKEGKIKREGLSDISGRGRGRQVELARHYGLKDYPSPAGGCLLTDPAFSQKLAEMLEFWPDCTGSDIELLKHGRVFWLTLNNDKFLQKVLCVISRDEKEEGILKKLAKSSDLILELNDEVGPTTLIRNYQLKITNYELRINTPEKLTIENLKLDEGKGGEEILQVGAIMTGYYAPKARGREIKILITKEGSPRDTH